MFIHKITFTHFTERFFDNKDKSRDDFHTYVKFMITCASNLWINDWTHSPGFCVAISNSHYTVGGLDAIFLYVDIISACAYAYIYPNKGILYFQSDWIYLTRLNFVRIITIHLIGLIRDIYVSGIINQFIWEHNYWWFN